MTDPALRRAAYRVVVSAFAGTTVPSWLPELVETGLGGICLYGNNLDAGSERTLTLARELAQLSAQLIITADEEGGDVTRLDYGTGSAFPGNGVLGRYDDLDTTTSVARATAARLKTAGIWLDLAPDADVNSDPRNPVIGTRSFGADPHLVARHTVAFVDGLQREGVAACVKHFPGHGDTATDSHRELPCVNADLATLHDRELIPFAAAIAAGTACVMTSHIVVEAIDPGRPATLSHAVLTGLLRKEMGYDGVIVTDALDMAGASADIGVPAAAVAALSAGADLLLLGPDNLGRGPAHTLDTVEAILAAVESGALSADRLIEAAHRVDLLAATYGTGIGVADPAVIEAGCEAGEYAAAAVIGDLDIDLPSGRALVIRIDTGSNLAVGVAPWGDLALSDADVVTVDERLAEITTLVAHPGPVIVVGRRLDAEPRVFEWLAELARRRPDTLVVELGWPGPRLSALPRTVLGWGSSPACAHAVGRAIERARPQSPETSSARDILGTRDTLDRRAR